MTILYLFLPRNGVVDEGGGLSGRGAHRGGEEPAVGRLQERDRRAQGLLEDRLLHRAEGGEQGRRGQAEAHQDLQREGACVHCILGETCSKINLPNLLVMPLITFMKAFPRESFLPTV